jgi:hypothetical protein
LSLGRPRPLPCRPPPTWRLSTMTPQICSSCFQTLLLVWLLLLGHFRNNTATFVAFTSSKIWFALFSFFLKLLALFYCSTCEIVSQHNVRVSQVKFKVLKQSNFACIQL